MSYVSITSSEIYCNNALCAYHNQLCDICFYIYLADNANI